MTLPLGHKSRAKLWLDHLQGSESINTVRNVNKVTTIPRTLANCINSGKTLSGHNLERRTIHQYICRAR